eukprot:TRINITY_DN11264_c0_g1_i1.p1 TRINITY_DN11264_c0_g1~~TRINITY_DN11264_c0_g1_i1.p1  ORF type:complete len:463 (-),score=16.96 TRINITY_DN11264_c0_g1_i1:140-1528(-)
MMKSRDVVEEGLIPLLLLLLLTCVNFGSAGNAIQNGEQKSSVGETAPEDVAALKEIYKSLIKIDENWRQYLSWDVDVDPCLPRPWWHLTCNISADNHHYRVIGLEFTCFPFYYKLSPTPFPDALTNLTALAIFNSQDCPITTYPDLSALTNLTKFISNSMHPANTTLIFSKLPPFLGSLGLRYAGIKNLTKLPPSLVFLDLTGNLFSDVSTLFNKTLYPNLTSLVISHLPNFNASTLPRVTTNRSIESVSNIKYLDTNYCHFSRKVTQGESQLDFLLALENLEKFSCSNCYLYGPLPTYLPRNINRFYASQSKLVGNLPDQWSNYTDLGTLILSDNNLTGPIPTSWSSLRNLTFFSVSYNQLSGTPPEWLNTAKVAFEGECNHWKTIPSWCHRCGCRRHSSSDHHQSSDHSDHDEDKKKWLWLLVIPGVFVIVGVVVVGYFVTKKQPNTEITVEYQHFNEID